MEGTNSFGASRLAHEALTDLAASVADEAVIRLKGLGFKGGNTLIISSQRYRDLEAWRSINRRISSIKTSFEQLADGVASGDDRSDSVRLTEVLPSAAETVEQAVKAITSFSSSKLKLLDAAVGQRTWEDAIAFNLARSEKWGTGQEATVVLAPRSESEGWTALGNALDKARKARGSALQAVYRQLGGTGDGFIQALFNDQDARLKALENDLATVDAGSGLSHAALAASGASIQKAVCGESEKQNYERPRLAIIGASVEASGGSVKSSSAFWGALAIWRWSGGLTASCEVHGARGQLLFQTTKSEVVSEWARGTFAAALTVAALIGAAVATGVALAS